IRIDKEYGVIKCIVVRAMPSHLLRQRVKVHPTPNRRVIVSRPKIIGVDIEGTVQFLAIELPTFGRTIAQRAYISVESSHFKTIWIIAVLLDNLVGGVYTAVAIRVGIR